MNDYQISDDKLPLSPLIPFLAGLVWNLGTPPDSEPVIAFSIETFRGRKTPYEIPFPVRFRDGAWRHAATGDVLKCNIEGWRS